MPADLPPEPRIARAGPDFADWPRLMALLHAAYAPMEGVIDPPSSLLAMTAADLAAKARDGVLLLAREGDGPLAGCLFCAAEGDALHLSKLAVRPERQGEGLARALVAAAEREARARGLARLTLSSRVELTANHAVFARLGFRETGRTAHPGFDRPTSIAFAKPLT
jgi:GNAT superfamily N-acetyltransferase